MKLSTNFTDLVVNGEFVSSPFLPGDEIEVVSITQTCPDMGCCEVVFTLRDPSVNDGLPFEAMKYFDPAEVQGFESWSCTFDKARGYMIYRPPEASK